MPVHLPQLSRRDFLKRAGLAGFALALAPELQAGWFGKKRDRDTVVFFSDCHIAGDATTAFNHVNMADNLAATIREFMEWPVKPAALIVNGDLAHRTGLPADYQRFGSLIAPVRAVAPIHLSLGNHDDRQNFWSAFPQDATLHSPELHRQATVFSTERANWFLVDSLDLTNHTPGEIGIVQRDWLSRELEKRPDKPAIVVGHHNLQFFQFGEDSVIGLKDSAEFGDLLVRHPQVKAFVFGHTHDWHVETHASGVHLINLPPTAYVFQAGRPSGWVRTTLNRNGAEFELRSLDKHHPEHGQIKQLTWRTA